MLRRRGRDDEDKKARMDIFDYVIVGAGSAGCVVANRLSEDPNVTCLLYTSPSPRD